MNVVSIVCSLHSSFLNFGMQLICLKDLESEGLVLNSEFCIRGLEGRLTFFLGHLLAGAQQLGFPTYCTPLSSPGLQLVPLS